MKALTISQPWATLIAIGAKRIETRSWKPPANLVDQQLAIHAGKGLGGIEGGEQALADLCNTEPFREALAPHYAGQLTLDNPTAEIDASLLPRGEIVAICEVEAIVPLAPIYDGDLPLPDQAQPHELEFGHYYYGRYGIVLGKPTRLPPGHQATGALGLWEWEHGRVATAA